MIKKCTKLFLRVALSLTFLSACLDRFGWFWHHNIAWGNWADFVDYTHQILPWFSHSVVNVAAVAATALELIFALFLLIGWKVRLFANLSGVLLLLFALAMTFSNGIKTAFDMSVFTASAAAFALATMRTRFLEIR